LEFVKSAAWTKMAADGQALGRVFFELRESGDEFMSNLARSCSSLRRFPVMSLPAAIWWAVMNCASLHAAPITFRFDAKIGTVFPGIPFDSGMEFAEGDVISGRFSFDSADGNGGMTFNATQPYATLLTINGVNLTTSTLQIESVNDAVIADFPAASVIDLLELAAGGLSAADSTDILNFDSTVSGFSLLLYGPASSFPVASHPSDVTIWNNFNLWRQLSITFRDGRGGAIGFQATVGQFVAVPEPSTFGTAALMMVVSLLIHHEIIPDFHRRRR
jgi:hypothetical protein